MESYVLRSVQLSVVEESFEILNPPNCTTSALVSFATLRCLSALTVGSKIFTAEARFFIVFMIEDWFEKGGL